MDEQIVLNLTKQITEMTSLLTRLNEEIQKLREENMALKKENESLKNENALLKEEVEYLKKKLFGTKSETSRSLGIEQLSLFDEAERECEPELLEEISYKRRKKKYKDQLKLKLESLPREEVILTLDEDERICPQCGHKLNRVGKEHVRSEIQFIPARLVVKDIYRETFECRNCKKEGNIMMVKPGIPAPVIPHSYASAESVAHIMKEKYVNGVPLYRQEAEWKRLGLELSRATMANWIIISSKEYLIPLKERMHEILLQGHYVHCDETPIQVLNELGKKNTDTSYMWVYANIKESETPIRIFEYKPTRAECNAQKILEGFSGYVITDGYAGYNQLQRVTNVYCWAHARRKFVESIPAKTENINETLAKQGLDKIGKLFGIEKDIETLDSEEKIKKRQELSKPILEEFFKWCKENRNQVSRGSKISKAIEYALNHQKGLSEYIHDGRLPMTNSLDERTIRPFTTGRKNWLFSASTKGADASAAAYSIIETAKANGLDPYKYLTFIFSYLPSQDLVKNPEKLDEFLPWSETVKAYCK